MSGATSRGAVLTFGEGLGVLRTTSVGSLAQLSGLEVGTGGAECNVAIGLARLGARATEERPASRGKGRQRRLYQHGWQ